MVGYSRARSAAAFCLSLAVHTVLFGSGWYLYQSGRAAPVAVENVLGWESLEYLVEEEHAPAPPPAPEPPPPTPPQTETAPEPKTQTRVEEKTPPLENKKKNPPNPTRSNQNAGGGEHE